MQRDAESATDASEDLIVKSPSRPSRLAARKDSQGRSPYGDDGGGGDRDDADDAASPYGKRGPAAIARWYACFRLVSR